MLFLALLQNDENDGSRVSNMLYLNGSLLFIHNYVVSI